MATIEVEEEARDRGVERQAIAYRERLDRPRVVHDAHVVERTGRGILFAAPGFGRLQEGHEIYGDHDREEDGMSLPELLESFDVTRRLRDLPHRSPLDFR